MGYPHGKKGWKLYDLETHEIIVSRDVVFYEHIYPFSLAQNRQLKSASSPMLEPTAAFDFSGTAGANSYAPQHHFLDHEYSPIDLTFEELRAGPDQEASCAALEAPHGEIQLLSDSGPAPSLMCLLGLLPRRAQKQGEL